MIEAPIEPLSVTTFNLLRRLIYEKTHINMRESKQILVSNRLRKRIIALGLSGYEEYYRYLTERPEEDGELAHFIDAVSTNETYFFREINHFDALREAILPELAARKERIRIWSAGCSTGEEAYSLRLLVEERLEGGRRLEAQIIGTDISRRVIEKARAAVYNERSVRFAPAPLVERCFERTESGSYRLKEALRRGVEFRVHNLLRDPLPEGTFDLIFCRNVMIYFDKPTQRRLVDERFAQALAAGGYLCIGHSESLTGTSQSFGYVRGFRAPIYRKKTEAQ